MPHRNYAAGALGAPTTLAGGHTNTVLSLVVLQNNQLASGSSDKFIKVWDVVNRVCVATLMAHTDSVNSLVVLPNGILVSASLDNSIKIWDFPTLTPRLTEERTLMTSKVVEMPATSSATLTAAALPVSLEPLSLPDKKALALDSSSLQRIGLPREGIDIKTEAHKDLHLVAPPVKIEETVKLIGPSKVQPEFTSRNSYCHLISLHPVFLGFSDRSDVNRDFQEGLKTEIEMRQKLEWDGKVVEGCSWGAIFIVASLQSILSKTENLNQNVVLALGLMQLFFTLMIASARGITGHRKANVDGAIKTSIQEGAGRNYFLKPVRANRPLEIEDSEEALRQRFHLSA